VWQGPHKPGTFHKTKDLDIIWIIDAPNASVEPVNDSERFGTMSSPPEAVSEEPVIGS